MVEAVVSVAGVVVALMTIFWKLSSTFSFFSTKLKEHNEKFDCIEKDLPEIKKQLGEINVRLEFHQKIITELTNDFKSFLKSWESKKK